MTYGHAIPAGIQGGLHLQLWEAQCLQALGGPLNLLPNWTVAPESSFVFQEQAKGVFWGVWLYLYVVSRPPLKFPLVDTTVVRVLFEPAVQETFGAEGSRETAQPNSSGAYDCSSKKAKPSWMRLTCYGRTEKNWTH